MTLGVDINSKETTNNFKEFRRFAETINVDPDDLANSTIAACNEEILRGVISGRVRLKNVTTPGSRRVLKRVGILVCRVKDGFNALTIDEDRF